MAIPLRAFRVKSLRVPALYLGLIAVSITSGCMLFPESRHQKSGSLVSFLFPKEKPSVQTPSMPHLELPLRVGIAFVPAPEVFSKGALSEMKKQAWMEKVAAQFRTLPYVQSLDTVPSAYLRPGGGFENLDQLRSLLGIDVVVLLSYDQTQFTDANVFSLAYWTIVGAYIVQGNRNDTHTLMEATVYDIASRSLLFRSPGVNQTQASTAAVYRDQNLRADSATSFDLAVVDLTKNLQTSLDHFGESVKAGRTAVKITHKPGYSGVGLGAIDRRTAALMLVAFLVIAALYARKHLGRCSRRDHHDQETIKRL